MSLLAQVGAFIWRSPSRAQYFVGSGGRSRKAFSDFPFSPVLKGIENRCTGGAYADDALFSASGIGTLRRVASLKVGGDRMQCLREEHVSHQPSAM